jgi:GDP-L-fucose synthase
VDDVASGLLALFERVEDPEPVNLGTGIEITISDLALLIARRVGFEGDVKWNTDMPDGMPRKCLDVSRLHNLGFHARISLEQGILQVIDDYRARKIQGRV